MLTPLTDVGQEEGSGGSSVGRKTEAKICPSKAGAALSSGGCLLKLSACFTITSL